uniref:NADH dehydrogenase [ubiquinone] 1 alpha subcomplex subunit 12 n=1 Tax=Nelumbo nucifera TaxID=4432 RepID=A0A822XN53_NELNU|nr:TPA_asm: hypothetical protein HUJ06_021942 [Nelumbo nucifera]
MSKLFAKISGFFSSRTLVGVDKAGNRYFTRKEEIDGIIEWICWLNGQRKKAPTPEEMLELETRRERVKLNVALLKKEEEERKAKEGGALRVKTGKVGGPDLKSFIRQFPTASTEGGRHEDISNAMEDMRNSQETEEEKIVPPQVKQQPVPSEPTGSGPTFKPGTWQPPT